MKRLYFEKRDDWREWLATHHDSEQQGVWLIFYRKGAGHPTLSYDASVEEALCFGWIDSTVKGLGNGKRMQYFCRRNPKSNWSALNKRYIKELESSGLIHESGYKSIDLAKENGCWSFMDDVENGIIPSDLQTEFDKNPKAFENYQGFSKGYQKSYLSWLKSAKREATRENRISEIIKYCNANVKSRNLW